MSNHYTIHLKVGQYCTPMIFKTKQVFGVRNQDSGYWVNSDCEGT